MNIHPLPVVVFSLIAGASWAHSQDADHSSLDEFRGARITLPYEELRLQLDKKMDEQPKAPAPVEAVVRSASYTLDFSAPPGRAGKVDLTVRSLIDDWQLVPIVDASYAVTGVAPDDATLVTRNGMICLVLNSTGDHNVTLEFSPGEISDAPVELSVRSANSIRLQLMNVPDGRVARVDGGTSCGDGEYLVPSMGGDLVVSLADDRPEVPTEWGQRSEALVTSAAGELRAMVAMSLTAENPELASGMSAGLDVPADVHVVNVVGEDLKSWRRLGHKDGQMRVRLDWKSRGAMARKVRVHCVVPLVDDLTDWTVPWPRIAGREAGPMTAFIVVPDGVDVTSVAGGERKSGRVSLPEWCDQSLPAGNVVAVAGDGDGPMVVQMKARQRMKTAAAIIRSENVTTEIASNGGMLSSATVEIEHDDAIRWHFTLPDGSALLSCAVGGVRVDPMVGEDGSLEVAVPAATDDGISKVAFSYTSQSEKLAPVDGRLQLALPSTPLFAHELTWRLQLPASYEATALEGNVEIVEGGRAGKIVVLRKQLFRGAQPIASVFYSKAKL